MPIHLGWREAKAMIKGALLALAVVAAAVPSAASADGRERQRFVLTGDVLVLVSGCDGLIATGGVAPTGSGPFEYWRTHNFVASARIKGTTRVDPNVANSLNARMRIKASGTDASGQRFRIRGRLTEDMDSPDFWASDGRVTVRREDGSFARGKAGGAFGIVHSGEFQNWFGMALSVVADRCRLR
jgi:hypothetical protein